MLWRRSTPSAWKVSRLISHLMGCTLPPNNACTRTAGFAPLNWLFRGFGLFPFRERVSSLQPPVTRAIGRLMSQTPHQIIMKLWLSVCMWLILIAGMSACVQTPSTPPSSATVTPRSTDVYDGKFRAIFTDIVPGKMTEAEVVELLGPPTGRHLLVCVLKLA